ncbi:MAG: fructose-bisphosphate aldolase [Rhizobiales bacterium TMED249]|uniref:Fructose-bisphosphate aldolase n=1 Tax=PS1 clade bacterium TaxID=2175152 RepID=A0A368DX06_9PROT|nr:MAG: fructose-bisphosphate aldolase [Rhizobiales bacterium TMED249]RCL76370.1 MAG: fructose-bisphosphate aldolase class I [PS1 clade bacterium]HCV48752.1 fructose-bisphosphate aldolase class I [Rhodobiaceae bacterium]|tara:strand:- start:1110 stop:2129 length:1020 start_codon:yes stop_codon:yes gene_type:complete
MDKKSLEDIAQKMVADGKGILAADESTGTIKKRFDTIALESTEDSRRDYREMLFRSDEAMQSAISGVILYDETIRQKAADGTTLVSLIEQAGSIPGIKVDTGAKDMAGHPNEKVTEGLDGLRERLEEYFKLGARFAKWRAVINIGDGIPSRACISANTHALARYAALCQENGIVPIVEPEVIMDGSHTAETCYEVTSSVLSALYTQLEEQNVYLEGSILKPNMIVSGTECPTQASVQQVAEMTLDCFNKCVPQAVPGIIFLSGGQADELATAHLDAINKMGPLSWKISFSYGRALQAAPLKTWSGKPENISAAQAAFTHRASMNKLAALGEWHASLEKS